MSKLMFTLAMSFIASACGTNQAGNSMLDDAFESYNFTKQYGDQSDICVTAGVVKLEYLDLQDKINYAKWKKIQNKDCAFLSNP